MSLASSLAIIFVLILSGVCTQAQQQPQQSFRACYMLFGPLMDLGYTFAHNNGRLQAHAMLSQSFPNHDLRSEYQEGAFFMDQDAILRRYIAQGCDVIHATYPGANTPSFHNFVRNYTNVTFTLQNGFNVASSPYPNLIIYASRPYESWYVAGLAAGRLLAKSATAANPKCVAFAAAYMSNAEVAANVRAFFTGVAEQGGPHVRKHLVEVRSWYYPVKEGMVAEAIQRNLKCDIVAQYGDSFAVGEFCTRDGSCSSIQMHGQANRYLGDRVFGCIYSDWSDVYYRINRDRILHGGSKITTGRHFMWANISRLCDFSPVISDSETSNFAQLVNADPIRRNPFPTMTDSRLRNMSIADLPPGVVNHGSLPDPPAGCPSLGQRLSFTLNASTQLLQPVCTACPENTFGDADHLACAPCQDGKISSPGSGACHDPPEEKDNLALIVGASAGSAIVVLTIAFIVVIVALRQAQKDGERDVSNAPQSTPCALAFTDIVGSTELWQDDPDAMSKALELHNQIIRLAITDCNGYEVKTIGDSFYIATATPEQMLRIARDIMTNIYNAQWPTSQRPLRIRMGIVWDSPEIVYDEVAKAYDYVGPAANLAARIEQQAGLGEIFVTKPLCAKVGSDNWAALDVEIEPRPRFVDLKGIDGRAELYAVRVPQISVLLDDERRRMEALATAAAARVNNSSSGTGGGGRRRRMSLFEQQQQYHPTAVTNAGGGGGKDSADTGSRYSVASSGAGSAQTNGGFLSVSAATAQAAEHHPLVVSGRLTLEQFAAYRNLISTIIVGLLATIKERKAVLTQIATGMSVQRQLPADLSKDFSGGAAVLAGRLLQIAGVDRLGYYLSEVARANAVSAACDQQQFTNSSVDSPGPSSAAERKGFFTPTKRSNDDEGGSALDESDPNAPTRAPTSPGKEE